ncbi:MAG: thioredoxin domain-containing protein [Pseudomonadota bacterium]
MSRFTRRFVFGAFASLALVACGPSGQADNGDGARSAGGSNNNITFNVATQDVIKGEADAPLTLVEYASWTCPACLQFDQQVMPMVTSEFIETGKVRFVFREFPTPPAELAVAGFALARCSGSDTYYDVVDELFERQPAMLTLARNGGQVREALMEIASKHGISGEAAFDACLNNSEARRAISTSIQRADAQGVNSTPTVFLNGKRLEGFDWRTEEGMRSILNEALGEDAADAPETDNN